MSVPRRLSRPLPAAAGPALRIAARLREAGHAAFLAGGCVRDLLMGGTPQDYDIATDATPERVCALFRATRRVGAQFGVVLVRERGRWVEVATFRSDGCYRDGRHPEQVTFSDARADALRRDFTINGMFLEPQENVVIDYVGGRDDIAARLIRAIGDPQARFEEDHLRMLRAVRFAARLEFAIEAATFAAIRARALQLRRVAAERVREELEKMLADPRRARAWDLLTQTGLHDFLWQDAQWRPEHVAAAADLLARLPADAPFEAALAVLLADRQAEEIQTVARRLTLSNEQREAVGWLVAHAADLDDPDSLALAGLKRLMAHPAFGALRMLAEARHAGLPAGESRTRALRRRLDAIAPDAVRPAPFVTGEDLIRRGVPTGPIYAELLEALYERQLDETLGSRDAALRALDELLARRNVRSG